MLRSALGSALRSARGVARSPARAAATSAGRGGGRARGGGRGRGGRGGGGRGEFRSDADVAGGRVIEDAAAACGADVVPLVVLKRGKARLFREGNPLVFGGAVDCVIGSPPPRSGDRVVVTDGARNPVAWGVFNSDSMYRVRVLQSAADAAAEPELALDVSRLLRARVAEAARLRELMGVTPTPAQASAGEPTSAFRLLNAEGDGLSGLVVDVFAHAAVVQSNAQWTENNRAHIEEALLKELPYVRRIVWRRNEAMLKLEGGEDALEDAHEGTLGGEGEGEGDSGGEGDTVEVCEGGLSFGVDLAKGQKTGFYCDQRDSRAWLRSLAGVRGASVLDLCCYTGGFALSAAAGGAGRVLGVDSSERAVTMAQSNAQRNEALVGETQLSFRAGDAIDVARELAASGERFDIVVLDPPKLAPSAKAVRKAERKYAAFNAAALECLRPGGILVTHSCSGAVARSGQLREIVEGVALRAGRRAQLVRRAGAAPDHPVSASYPESQYLDSLAFVVK